MGLAFAAVITSLVDNLVMPIIAMIIGKPSFDDLTFTINDAVFRYGAFITALITFVSIAAACSSSSSSRCKCSQSVGSAARRHRTRRQRRHDTRKSSRSWSASPRIATRSASRPIGEARREIAHPAEREQHSGDVSITRERVVADGQQLPVSREQHFLVRDEARQADGVDGDLAAHRLCGRLRRPGRRVELRLVVRLDDLRARQVLAASAAKRIISTAPSAKFGA